MLDQQEFKSFLRDILKHGDLVKLANYFGISEAAISQKLNQNLEVPCDLYRGLKWCHAICVVNKDAGAKLRALINDLFDTWLVPAKNDKPKELLGEISSEFSDLLKAHLSNKPIHLQRKEALELQAEVTRFVESLTRVEAR